MESLEETVLPEKIIISRHADKTVPTGGLKNIKLLVSMVDAFPCYLTSGSCKNLQILMSYRRSIISAIPLPFTGFPA